MKNAIENLRQLLLSKFTVKQHNTFANLLMVGGVIINTLEIMNNPMGWNWTVNLIAIALVILGAVYQSVIVRCPVCGDKLKGKASKLMDRCPNCNHELTKLPTK